MAKASALRDLTVSQLEKVLLAKKSKLEELVQKREKLQKELSQLDVQIRGLAGSEMGSTEEAPRKGRSNAKRIKRRRARIKGQKSLRWYVQQELEKSKKGLTQEEVTTAVQNAGYRSKSDKFSNVMYQCLYHHFQRDADSGKWGIRTE